MCALEQYYVYLRTIVTFALFYFFRGISSTVRRCIEKETGHEYAAKIIDLSQESQDGVDTHTMRDATRQEISILRLVTSHPFISE